MKENVPFNWQQEQQSAFEELKDRLVRVPVLAYPNFSAEAGSYLILMQANTRGLEEFYPSSSRMELSG